MANTTNFGWETPDDTDLVKDGAAAMRTLGNSIDASFVDLKGGTTGQVLAKASNTDLDYTWVTQDDANAIQNTIVDAKGDLITATANDTPSRLGVGTNGQVLTANSATATGLQWATPAAGGANYVLLNSGGTALSGSVTTVSGISGRDSLLILIDGASSTVAGTGVGVRFNTDSNPNYAWWGNRVAIGSAYSSAVGSGVGGFNNTEITLGICSNTAASIVRASLRVEGGNSSGVKVYTGLGGGTASGGTDQFLYSTSGFWDNTATISSISVYVDGGTFDAGRVYVYTSA